MIHLLLVVFVVLMVLAIVSAMIGGGSETDEDRDANDSGRWDR